LRLSNLRKRFLDSLKSPGSRRVYGRAFDRFIAYLKIKKQALSSELLADYRDSLLAEKLSPSTINCYLGAVSTLVRIAYFNDEFWTETLPVERVPRCTVRASRNRLNLEQARELIAVPDRKSLKGKRDSAILSILVSCGLNRAELARVNAEDIILKNGRWAFENVIGRGGRSRTVNLPGSTKERIDEWSISAGITRGALLRQLSKSGRVLPGRFGAAAIWRVVVASSKAIGITSLCPRDLRRTCAVLCHSTGAATEQIQFLLGHASSGPTKDLIGADQNLDLAVNENLGI
jgi:integrase